jgi:putative peptidoglycan lipid II flippase
MIRSFLTVSVGTLASRLLGFARDAMIAALLGTGGVADAFLVAFQLVNVIRRLLTEGALNAALVPAWLRLRETEGAIAAAAFAGTVLGTISAALMVPSTVPAKAAAATAPSVSRRRSQAGTNAAFSAPSVNNRLTTLTS